jgi:hypothetical protein
MPQDDFRIFLSAVNSEFRRAGDLAVAEDLRLRGLKVRVRATSGRRRTPGDEFKFPP